MSENTVPAPVSNFSMVPGISRPPADPADVLSTLLMETDRNNIDLSYNVSSPSLFKNIIGYSPHQSPITKSSEGIVPEIPGSTEDIVPPPSAPQVSSMNRSKKRKAQTQPNEIKIEEVKETEFPSKVADGGEKELSVEEVKDLKKQKRLAKNREAAQMFRQRQKDYISQLESLATELSVANTEASARVELLTSENKLMKEQLGYLRSFMKQAVSVSWTCNPVPQQMHPFPQVNALTHPTLPTLAPSSSITPIIADSSTLSPSFPISSPPSTNLASSGAAQGDIAPNHANGDLYPD